MTHTLWTSLNQRMFDYLTSVHLAELVNEQRSNAACAAAIENEQPSRRPVRRIPVAAAV